MTPAWKTAECSRVSYSHQLKGALSLLPKRWKVTDVPFISLFFPGIRKHLNENLGVKGTPGSSGPLDVKSNLAFLVG